MVRQIKIPSGLNISIPGGEEETKKDVVPQVSSSPIGYDEEAPEDSEGRPAEPPIKQKSPRRGIARSASKTELAPQVVHVSNGVLKVLSFEKTRRSIVLGEKVTMGSIISEALFFYLKKTAKDSYEEYRKMGFIQ